MVTETTVWQALGDVSDPLLGQNLVDLGLVHDIQVTRDGRVLARLILPSPHWPASGELAGKAQAAIAGLPDVVAADVQLVAAPVWTPYRLARSLKTPLGLPVDEPPAPVAPALSPQERVRRLMVRLLGH